MECLFLILLPAASRALLIVEMMRAKMSRVQRASGGTIDQQNAARRARCCSRARGSASQYADIFFFSLMPLITMPPLILPAAIRRYAATLRY